ncbi:MAG: hypothetical protein M3419_07820 [Actinomycetota bacterium]|nr:hypothetical protein [Actinomycetota bacterium]
MATVVRLGAATAWLLAWLAGSLAAAAELVTVERVPAWLPEYGAATLTVLFAVALTRRSGGRVWFWSMLAGVPVAGALILDQRWLLSSVAVLAAVLGAIVAVMLTRPAGSLLRLLHEYLLALVLAASAGLAVNAWGASVDPIRFPLAVLVLTLILMIVLVWQLGAGYHGIGRRGLVLIAGGAVLVTMVLVYSRVLREYGSVTVIETVDSAAAWTTDRFGGVPRPIEVLVGFPALLWGVWVRSSRRQGWWMCAFGTVGTATVATTLANPDVELGYAGLSTAYSIALGLLLGLLVIRVDALLTGGRHTGTGRRARRDSRETDRVRPEPRRTTPLC